jgi:hypothetical protein
LSFPSEKYETKSQFADFVAETPSREQEKMKYEQSFEVFGYDALTLFSLAFNRMRLKGSMSRSRLNQELALDPPAGSELCYNYRFEKGENSESQYFVYSLGSDSIEAKYDKNYLSNVFTNNPTPRLIARYDNLAVPDRALRDQLAHALEADTYARALIITSNNLESEDAKNQELVLIKLLVEENQIDSKRIDVSCGVAQKQQTQIWLIPRGASPPKPPENFISIKGNDLLANSSLGVPNRPKKRSAQ